MLRRLKAPLQKMFGPLSRDMSWNLEPRSPEHFATELELEMGPSKMGALAPKAINLTVQLVSKALRYQSWCQKCHS